MLLSVENTVREATSSAISPLKPVRESDESSWSTTCPFVSMLRAGIRQFLCRRHGRPGKAQLLIGPAQRPLFGLSVEFQFVLDAGAQRLFKGRSIGVFRIVLLCIGAEIRLEDSGRADRQEVLIDDRIEADIALGDQRFDGCG